MRHIILIGLLLFAQAAYAQVPAAELVKAPAEAQHFSILSIAGKHGEMSQWATPDGTLMGRLSILLRGRTWEEDEAIRFGADGMIAHYALRGVIPSGDVGESFNITSSKAAWKSPLDSGTAVYAAPAFYLPVGTGSDFGPQGYGITALGQLAERLIAAPDHSLALLPGGRASIEKLASVTVGSGSMAKRLDVWVIKGINLSPTPVWTTGEGQYFGYIGSLSYLPAGYEDALSVLTKAQDDALAALSAGLVRSLTTKPAEPVAFSNVRAFVDGERFIDGQTVIVDQGKIVQITPAANAAIPANAQIIDGTGKTLVPGLWDAHQHVDGNFAGPLLLSLGVTSVRDPGNDVAQTKARAERRAKGELLLPHVYASMLIDGKGPNTAQVAVVATSQAEALAAVRQAKADGLTGVKFYGSFNPAWLPAAAAEAHQLGLHVHGHLPAGMRTMDAINAGYDEITHIYFVMMQAMPDNVVAGSNGAQRFTGTSRYAKDVDLAAEPMQSLIRAMAKRQITADPTLIVVEKFFAFDNGVISPAYTPYMGTLPSAIERTFRQGGLATSENLTRTDYRASFQKLVALVGALHQAGVPVVAGTDDIGLELVRELELYVEAGFTPAEALAAATIVPARLVGADAYTGTITVGKAADLVLVEGDPSRTIGDLRHTRLVMMDGLLMDADSLRAAIGFSGPPK